MTTVISTINLKGGVGKTQLSVAVSEFMADVFKKKVLLIDLDPQTNATVMLVGYRRWKKLNEQKQTLYWLFYDAIKNSDYFNIDKAVAKKCSNVNGGLDNLHLLPSSLDIIRIQDIIPKMIKDDQFMIKTPTTILRMEMESILRSNYYDFIIIDCPPNLGTITINGLVISDYLLVPTKADEISTYGLPEIFKRINVFCKYTKKNIIPLGIIITMYSRYMEPFASSVINLLRRKEGYPDVFDDYIPYSVEIARRAMFDDNSYTLKQKYGRGYKALENITQTIIKKV